MDTAADNAPSVDNLDFSTQTSTSYTDCNYSSDTTAPGNTNYQSQSSSSTFVSNSAPFDFHLKSGANAIGAGKDAGTNETVVHREMPYPPFRWNIDIDGRDRDSEGDDWDIGADQSQGNTGGGGDDTTNVAFMLFFD
jgi:hypothetical protein